MKIPNKIQEWLTANNAKKTMARYTLCCPFHKERTPSFSINTNTNTYHCFGCSKNGSLEELEKELNERR